ncbi:MAG: aldehyde ferredoxin oxidoreductase N-terminal domain-containing protein, partial [Nitrososphaerota archaeon]
MIKGGYVGKILRVDLTKEKIWYEPLPDDEILRKFVGGWGLGLKLLYDMCPSGIHPLEPENPMIFMTGPLTGIPAIPAANNTTLTTLNGDTGFT